MNLNWTSLCGSTAPRVPNYALVLKRAMSECKDVMN